MNMDVNLHRLPDKMFCLSKFLVPLAGLIPHPHPADSADIRSKQAERQFIIKQNMQLRTTGIFHPINKYPSDNRNYFMQAALSIRHVYKSNCSIKKLAFAKETV